MSFPLSPEVSYRQSILQALMVPQLVAKCGLPRMSFVKLAVEPRQLQELCEVVGVNPPRVLRIREVMSLRPFGDAGLQSAFDGETGQILRSVLTSAPRQGSRLPGSQFSQPLKIFACFYCWARGKRRHDF
jgi:hypothetical protein